MANTPAALDCGLFNPAVEDFLKFLDSTSGEAAPVADIVSEFDIFPGMIKEKYRVLPFPVLIDNCQPLLVSARFLYVCKKIFCPLHSFHTFFRYLMHHWNRKSESLKMYMLIDPQEISDAWDYLFLTVWTYYVFSPKNPLTSIHPPHYCYMQTRSHKVITIPCPALSLTLSWCKSRRITNIWGVGTF